ncbi:MAG TPA: 50S ribosomal protein L18 [Candidatus Nanoarchaeia archaeon]|nr:50S ribosomal protein L18 [Candidatus Nanoarchaeia archaeon]
MIHTKTKPVAYRRKREGRTNYAKRRRLLESGKPRLVVRFSNKQIRAQLVTFQPSGDRVEAAVDAAALRKLGWKFSAANLPAAYLMGVLAGQAALVKKHTEAIFDTGLATPLPRGRLFAFLQGALDAGLRIPHGEAIFPSPERLRGQHIAVFAAQAPGKEEKGRAPQFAEYLKNGLHVESLPEQWETLCKKLGVSPKQEQKEKMKKGTK